MCVIVVKKAGQELPNYELLFKCFQKNPDGCGFMYNHNQKVHIEKGFMHFDKFYKRILDLDKKINLKSKGVVFHFRIMTSGKISRGNCHPFPISESISKLKKLNVNCEDIAFCHNGIINNYLPLGQADISDTQLFSIEVLSMFYKYDKNFYKNEKVLNAIEKLCKSKLCFLNCKGDIYLVGSFFKSDGYLFSNLNFKMYQQKYFYDYEDYDFNLC